MKTKIFGLLLLIITFGSCDDFLTRAPLDSIEDNSDFWNNENNIRNTVVGLYDIYFEGYRIGWNRSDYFYGTSVADWTDDLAQTSATFFTKTVPATDATNWTFNNVRRINLIIDRVTKSNLPDEAKNHWLGVGRFFRALEYSRLVSKFGDVPWYDKVIEDNDVKSLYKAKDPRTTVMDNVLADLDFACKNIRESDGLVKGLSVTRAAAMAYTSRIMLFEGTWQKYRAKNTDFAKKYLTASQKAASDLMATNTYSLASSYKSLTNSLSLASNPEMIIYRSYVAGVLTHSLMSFQVEQAEVCSPSKDLVDSYLSINGLPIHQTENTLFKGDKWISDEVANRDSRLADNIDVTSLKLVGVEALYAVSGYMGNRFVNESVRKSADGLSNTNVTDAPIMKYNEVLMNYIEASAELAQLGAYTLSQTDFDKSFNLIRTRAKMPTVKLEGNNLSVNGVIVNDPDRDLDVPSLIWEIRRERRVELVFEGIRFNDLRRWNKLQYADMILNQKLNLGAWLDKEAFVAWYNANNSTPITIDKLKSIKLDREGNAGYIKPILGAQYLRTYAEKDYLYPIPTDQIKLYKDKATQLNDPTITLEPQNPGW
jgi:SusD family.